MTVTILGVVIGLGKLLNSAGLVMDIFGAVLLFKYGLPAEISRTGAVHIIAEQSDEAEITKARIYDRWGHLGLASLIGGFVLQLVSNFL
jgi:hypothetical protein